MVWVEPATQNFQRWNGENTLFQVNGETIHSQSCEKLLQVNEVCLLIWGADPRVINIGKHLLQIADNTVHHALESLCGIGQPKWSDQILKQAKWRDNCRCDKAIML